MLRALLVEDEPLAARRLANLLRQHAGPLELLGPAESVTQAVALLQAGPMPDVLFLDIHLADGLSFELFEQVTITCPVIFTTAYDQYALRAFKVNSVDYLLKPIALERFLQAATKAREYFLLRKAATEPVPPTAEYIFVKHALRYEKIALTDILYVEGLQNYVVLHTTVGKRVLHLTLKAVMQTLTAPQFLRIHKSYLINTQHLLAVEGHMVHIGQVVLPISRAQREDLLQQVVYDKLLWKK